MSKSLKQLKIAGFTVVELLIVIVVIGILVSVSIVTYNGVQRNAIDKAVLSDVDGVSGEVARYGTKNQGVYDSAVTWYSPNGANSNITFVPSSGSVIDVVSNSTDYCIRGYNTSSATYKTLASGAVKESTTGSCDSIAPSSLAIAAAPNTFTKFALVPQTGPGSHEWSGGVASSYNGQKLVAGDDCGKLITSTDFSNSWVTRIAECPVGQTNYVSIASSSDGTKLLAGSRNGYDSVYTSTDSGVTWTPRVASTTAYGWSYVASSSDGTKLVAVSNGNPGSVYTSTDSGVTWTQRGSYVWPQRVASSSDGTKLAVILYGGYIYTSMDSGVTWTQQTGSGIRNWQGVASSSDGTKLAATVNGGYVYTSTDSGVTWTQQTGSGIRGWLPISSSSDGTKLIAADYNSINNNYIYTSTDSGVTWTERRSAGSHYWWDIVMSSDGSRALLSPEVGYLLVGVFY